MNIRQFLVTVIVFASTAISLVGQCDVTLGAPILDNTIGSIEIVIDGALNNDLSNTDQGVCGVELYFQHESIRDVAISLVSPSGQSIDLVGPATGSGGATQFTYWGVEFVPCGSAAMPDLPILDPVFTTQDNWGIFGNYSGQYYPQQGCLEDFDSGSVNGTWTLNFSDVFSFDEGAIDSIKLVFCDTTNIFCLECLADGGTLAAVDSDYCESDPNLNLDIDPVFETEPDINLYSYNFLIVQGGEVIEANLEPDFTNYNFGSYQVCGISSLIAQTEDILDDVIGTDYNDLLELFSDNDYCASMSTNCIPINIIEVPDTILTIDTICLGDFVLLDGTEYSVTGEYVISFSQAFCDSVSILDLFVIDNQATIIADSEMISCTDGDVLLDASGSITSPGTVMSWFKVDDVLDPNIVGNDMITVTEAGIYGLSLITGMCTDTAYVEIFNDESIPSFSFDADVLNCYNPAVVIDMTPSIELQDQSWSGPSTSSLEDLTVVISGTYYIEGVALNGCIGRDSIFIEEDLEVPVPLIVGDTITCATEIATIRPILPDSISYGFTWEGPNIVGTSIAGNIIEVSQDTTYTLRLQNLVNGCVEAFDYTVLIDTNRTNFAIQSTIIDCNIPNSEITVTPAIDTIDYIWEYENQGFVGEGDTISVNQGGEYQLVTTTSNGCMDTFFHTVILDLLEPVLTIDDVTVSCLQDSVQLVPNTLETDLTFFWNGPGNFQSTQESPFVTNPGLYNLVSTSSSGCFSNTSVNVFSGDDLPNITFEISDTLDCNVDVVTITPSDTLNLRFEWQSDLIADTTANIIDVNLAGMYPLVVTDTISGCRLLYELIVEEDFETPEATIEMGILDCINSMVTINISFLVEIDSLKWTTDFGFSSTEQSPTVTQGGDYDLKVTGVNGCIYTETITVVEDIDLPIISITTPLLGCQSPSVDISFDTDLNTDELYIRLPNGDVILGSSLSVTEPNSYWAIATSLTGCTDSMIMVVLQDTIAPVATLMTNGQINCTETTTTILVDHQEEGLTYDWTGVSIVSPLGLDSIVVDAEGLYSVVVSDSANCSTTLDIPIQSFIDFPIVSHIVDTINCAQAVANITLNVPANTILTTWEGPSVIDQDMTEFSVDMPGSYIATVTADNNCETMQTIVVVVDTIYPEIDVMSSGILDCDTEFVTLTGSSDLVGSSFDWTGPDNDIFTGQNVDVNLFGSYDLLVTAPNMCMMDTFIVVEADTLRPTIDAGEDLIFSCADGKVTLAIQTTTNIISYAWEGPFSYESDLEEPLAIAPGLYTVTVTNDRGCATSADINVIDDTEGPEIMVRDTFITCDQIAVPLPLDTDDTEISYTWDAPGFSSDLQNPETNTLGEYIIYAISDRNECVTVDTVNVTYVDVPPVFDFETDNINCYRSQTTLKGVDVEDDSSVTWTDDNFNFLAMDSLVVEMADSFYIIVVGTNACADTAIVMVEEDFEEVDIEIILNEPFQCKNLDVTLEGSVIDVDEMDDFSATWSTTNGTITGGSEIFDVDISGEGTYFLRVLNFDNGCESVDSILMVKDPQSFLGITVEANDPNCLGFQDGSINVTNVDGGFGPFEYIIDNELPQSDSTFTDLSVGSYMIEVIDSLGCTIEMDVNLLDGLDFMVEAEMETTIIVGDTINLNSVFNIPNEEVASTTWTAHNIDYSCDDCFEPPVSPLINTYYTLNATSIGGCQDSSEVLIRVNRNPDIEVANVFAPGSETNGLFYIQQTRGIERVLSMSVFDKWASRMFSIENVLPADPSAAWDGTYKGQFVNPGVYVVVAEILLYSGEIVTYAGDITVLR